MARSILHIDLDAFFASVEQAKNPELRGLPVIVGGDPDGRGVVSTASYEARRFGVYSGMPLRTAKRLAPDAVFISGHFSDYTRISKRFHAILAEYSPIVDSHSIDEAYMDLTGCEPVCGPPAVAAATIRARIRDELGLAASAGLATSRVVAKVATEKAKPDGFYQVPPGEEAAFLAPLPLRALPGLGENTEKRLVQFGISTIGQVAALSDSVLDGIFGPHGPDLGKRARGLDVGVWNYDQAAKSISREGTFAADVADPEHLRAVLRGFSESVGKELRRDGRRAKTVTLKLRFDDFTTVARSQTQRQPVNSNEAIYDAGLRLMEKIRAAEKRPVRLIGVGVSNLVADALQLSLEPPPERRQESLSATFDKVREKYGARSLQTGRTAFDAAAEEDQRLFDRGTGLSSQMK